MTFHSAESTPGDAASRDRTAPQLVEQLARPMGAEMAAVRPICDGRLRWAADRQLMGQTWRPIYVALGTSGAIPHWGGIKGRGNVAIKRTLRGRSSCGTKGSRRLFEVGRAASPSAEQIVAASSGRSSGNASVAAAGAGSEK